MELLSLNKLALLVVLLNSVSCEKEVGQAGTLPRIPDPAPVTDVPSSNPISPGPAMRSSYPHYPTHYGSTPSVSTYPYVGSGRYVDSDEPSSLPREGSGVREGGHPIMGLNSAADFQLSAYFGHIFWGAFAVILTAVTALYGINFFSGGQNPIATFFERIRGGGGRTGRALFVDDLTSNVYKAFENVKEVAGREARHLIARELSQFQEVSN